MNEINNKSPEIRFPGFTDAWEQRKLSEVAEFNPKSILPDEFEYVDLESVIGTEMVSHRTEKKETAPSRAQRLAKTGDVFYQTVRPYQRNNYLYDKPDNNYVFSTGYAQMRPNIDADFLMSFLQTDKFVNVVLENCTGTSYPAINSSDLSNLEIILPLDKLEQKKIGSFFRELDNTITLHQRKCDELKNLKKAMLQKMFPKNGSDVPEIRFPGFTDAWEQRKLKDICSEFQSGKSIKANDIHEIGVYAVYGGNGLRGYTNTYNHDGDYALIGRQGALCGNMNYSTGKAYFTEHAVAVQGDENNDTLFLYYLLDLMNLGQYSGQSAQPGLAVNKIIELKNYVPKLDEQKKISCFFKELDNTITLHQRKCDAWKELKKGLLQKMFV